MSKNTKLGSAVIVNGEIVAWFSDFNEESRDWCTENYFGQWVACRARMPEIVPLNAAELAAIECIAKKFFEAVKEIEVKNDN